MGTKSTSLKYKSHFSPFGGNHFKKSQQGGEGFFCPSWLTIKVYAAGGEGERVWVRGSAGNCGQSCIGAKRFIVTAPVYDRFLESFAAKMIAIKVPLALKDRCLFL